MTKNTTLATVITFRYLNLCLFNATPKAFTGQELYVDCIDEESYFSQWILWWFYGCRLCRNNYSAGIG